MARKRLVTLGFTDTMDDLDCLTADALLLVDFEVHKTLAEQAERKNLPGGEGHGW